MTGKARMAGDTERTTQVMLYEHTVPVKVVGRGGAACILRLLLSFQGLHISLPFGADTRQSEFIVITYNAMWGIVVSELLHYRKHTKGDGAAAFHCCNRCSAETVIVISGFDCIPVRTAGRVT